jgi:peptide/nickel transport system substrate-binding protein
LSTGKSDTERFGALRISRSDFLKISGASLAGVSLLGIAGCAGAGQQGGQQGGGGGGNTLIVGYPQEPPILNSFLTGGDALSTGDMLAGILESPLLIQPDLSYAPKLAEGDPEVVSEDPLVIQYRLKENLTFSDGKPLTTADAKWTYEQIMDPKNKIVTREIWDNVGSFETPDERTVRLTFKKPDARWRDALGGGQTSWILPKHFYEGKDFNKITDTAMGSGPFKLKEWNKGQSLTIERNDNYWGEKAGLDQVTFRFITDTNSLIAALESGEISFVSPDPDIGLMERLKDIQGTQVHSKPGVFWEHIAFNMEKVPNIKLRQAIAYGIDREQVVNELLKGQVTPLQSVEVPQLKEYYTPAWEQYNYDPDKAKQLVDEAKSEGVDPTLTFSTTAGVRLRETMQQVIQQQLKKVGIDINIKNTSADTFFGTWTVQGDFEMGDWAWIATPDPSLTTLFSATQVAPKGQNYYRYKNEVATRLMEQSDVTVNVDERAELIKQVQDIMAKDLPLIPMYQRPVVYAYSDDLTGPEVNPTLAGPFWNIGTWSLK